MIQAAAKPLRVTLFEGEGATCLSTDARGDLMRTLLDAGYPVTCVRERGRVPAADDSLMVLLGRFGDKATDLEDLSGDGRIHCQDIEGLDSVGVLDAVKSIGQNHAYADPGSWLPWFPVIDYDRCTNCMQCLSFCLFGVYGVDEKKELTVRNQDKCKTNCPACSRVCPEVAIMFPKYKNGPANGDEVKEEDVQKESMKVDISALLGGDIYQALKQRSENAAQRFSQERDEDRALLERKRCLEKMTKDMDIPKEVLMSLPSVSEIKQRAEEAKKAADDALSWRRDSVDAAKRIDL